MSFAKTSDLYGHFEIDPEATTRFTFADIQRHKNEKTTMLVKFGGSRIELEPMSIKSAEKKYGEASVAQHMKDNELPIHGENKELH